MLQRDLRLFILIVVIAACAAWVVWPGNPGIHIHFAGINIDHQIKVAEGLDLQGGLQVVLQAKNPDVSSEAMSSARDIVESRINALGVSEPLVQLQGSNRIVVEIPGIQNPDQAIAAIGQVGLLEIVDSGSTPLAEGSIITTTLGGPSSVQAGAAPITATTSLTGTNAITTTPGVTTTEGITGTTGVTTTPGVTTTAGVTTTPGITTTEGVTTTTPATTTAPIAASKVYTTVLTGALLNSAAVGFDETGRPDIEFTLRKIGNDPAQDGPKIFADYTSTHVGQYLSIVLDKKVISTASILTPITDGSGRITGSFTLAQAQSIVVVLKYGSLPVSLDVIENTTVGPTLGQDSLTRSVRAGAIGLLIVILFMLIYYRLPGVLADLALVIYATISFAIFKLVPVTLTLAGIAGFILSIGMAVDANILIFERMKEELRSGKTLGAAIEAGFARAWTSIRDSNASTLITCAILFWFGSNFGASIIKGFALTLAIGVLVSLFTAVTVTRTFLRVTQSVWFPKVAPEAEERFHRLFGVTE